MFQRRAGRLALILEQKDIAQPAVVLEVLDPVLEGVENLFYRFLRKVRETQRMLGRLDHDFMRAHTLHFVEQSIALAIEIAFNPEDRKLVGDHAQAPSRLVGRGAVPESEHFRGRLAFIARAEGAEAP